jgi:acyl-ACP thioesterase
MKSRPADGAEIVVRTWPRGSKKLFAVRDFDIACGGETVVSGRSGWLVVDLGTKKILRPESFMKSLPLNEGLDALDGIESLSHKEGAAVDRCIEREALYSDIDSNGHVNNARYVEWICDAVNEGGIVENAASYRLDLNFLHEIKLGEKITLSISNLQDTSCKNCFSITGKNTTANAAAFMAEFRVFA